NIICEVTGVDYTTAEKYYLKANKSFKVAIVMILNNCDYEKALSILNNNNNFINR
ncbi:N-acetylmuramic acid 6-phosphate etherase, partial [Francisella tularensis subsp. holarctica]|nr:N-acetylmuramic acid 6-phosphate etherase [Francisella tularensis subsp. holarctica]